MAREFLWRSCGMGGSDEAREIIAACIRNYHLKFG